MSTTAPRTQPFWRVNPLSDRVWVCTTGYISDYTYIQKAYFAPRKRNGYIIATVVLAAVVLSFLLLNFPFNFFAAILTIVLGLAAFGIASPRKPDNLVQVNVSDHEDAQKLMALLLKIETDVSDGKPYPPDMERAQQALLSLYEEESLLLD